MRIRHRLSGIALAAALGAAPLHAQQPAPAGIAYDVVSIKPNKSGTGMSSVGSTPDGYQGTNITLVSLLMSAYDLRTMASLTGLPGWANSTHFDLHAKLDPEAVAALAKLPHKESNAQRTLMLQALLADRFGLQVHTVSKEMPAYALVVAKSGARLKSASLDESGPNAVKGPDGTYHAGNMRMGMGYLQGQSITAGSIAANLGGQLQRQVVDRTGLTGVYDVTLKWTPDDAPPPASTGAPVDSGPSLMTALEEQLGLRLEPIKLMTDTIVVDHVQMPSEN